MKYIGHISVQESANERPNESGFEYYVVDSASNVLAGPFDGRGEAMHILGLIVEGVYGVQS